MSLAAGKLRVLIATTNGPVEVQLLTEEDAAIGRCVACIGGTTETADIAAAYHAFVVRPTGVVESRFGHSCYRLDVSGRIDAGSSWQLGVFAAHGLLAAGRLAQESDVADGVLWATGSLRPVDLTVGAVSHVPEKLDNSLARFEAERAAGRPVLVAVPAANAGQVSSAAAGQLAGLGVETIAPSHAQDLFDALGLALPPVASKATASVNLPIASTPAGASKAPPSRVAWIAAAIALIVIAAAATIMLVTHGPLTMVATSSQIDAAATPAAMAKPPSNMQAELGPERVEVNPDIIPFITTQDRGRVRTEYMSAPNFKALATSLLKMGFVSSYPSQDAADRGAMEACEKASGPVGSGSSAQPDRVCDLYASGPFVVTHRNAPPLPPPPWVDAAVMKPFDGSAVPLADARSQSLLDSYPRWARAKAAILAPNGYMYATYAQTGADDAMRRSLERCGYSYGAACLVVAVDDHFVVPIPTLAKAVGFYRPDALFGAKPEARKDAGRKLAGAGEGWSAVALGSAGNIGTKVGAPSEQDAVDGALKDCATRDRGCRIAVIGPFLVEAPMIPPPQTIEPPPPTGPVRTASPATPTIPVERVELDPDHVPFVTSPERERIRDEYLSAPSYKALAINLLRMAFVSGQPSQEAADRSAMEACAKMAGPVRTGSSVVADHVCDLYASGAAVVTRRNDPPLPSRPWINASFSRPFEAAAIPLIDAKRKSPESYLGWARPKAMVLSPRGTWYASYGQISTEDAVRRSLERCGYINGAACLVVAVDNTFVNPIPTVAKAVGFFRPDALAGLTPDDRKEVARRLNEANAGWNVVAVGANGHVGIKTGAASERDAVDEGLADCARRDKACRVVAIGPFQVEAPVQPDARPLEPPPQPVIQVEPPLPPVERIVEPKRAPPSDPPSPPSITRRMPD